MHDILVDYYLLFYWEELESRKIIQAEAKVSLERQEPKKLLFSNRLHWRISCNDVYPTDSNRGLNYILKVWLFLSYTSKHWLREICQIKDGMIHERLRQLECNIQRFLDLIYYRFVQTYYYDGVVSMKVIANFLETFTWIIASVNERRLSWKSFVNKYKIFIQTYLFIY